MLEGLCCDHLEPVGPPDGVPERGLAVQALLVFGEAREVASPDRSRVLLRGPGVDEELPVGPQYPGDGGQEATEVEVVNAVERGDQVLAQLLRADLLPEAWIAPAEVRQLRALLRHRVALVRLCTGLRNRIHAVTADHGFDRPDASWTGTYWTGPGRAGLPLASTSRIFFRSDYACWLSPLPVA